MTEVHFEGRVSLHVLDNGVVELQEHIPHNGTLRFTTADDPTLTSLRKRSEGGLSANEVCRRYAGRADVEFETAAAAVLDELESSGQETDGG
jgi:hypothetical protein